MATGLDLVIRARDQASDVLEGVGETGAKAGQWIDDNWQKVTAATAAAGAGVEGLARKVGPLNEVTRRLAASTDMTEDEVRGMSEEMSNATFPINEVLGLMEQGRKQGIKSAEELREYASFWDMVGDATGESSAALAEGGIALRGVGIAAGEEKEALAAFGFITQETSGSVTQFQQFLQRAGKELGDNTPHVNDMAAALKGLEDQGFDARIAQRELQQALREADGDMGKAIETLGISAEEQAEYRKQVEESSDVIERNAEIHAETKTPMEKLQSRLSDLQVKYGAVFESASVLTPVLLAAGPAMKGVSMAGGALGKTLPLVSKGAMLAKAGFAAMLGPIGLVVVAIAAAIAIGVLIVKHWDKIKAFLGATWDAIQAAAEAVFGFLRDLFLNFTPIGQIIQHWDRIAGFLTGIWDTIKRIVGGSVDWVKDKIVGVIRTIRGVWEDVWGGIGAVFSGVWSGIKSTFRGAVNTLVRGLNTFIRGVNKVKVPSWVPGIGGKGISIPTIPTLHRGGVFRAPTPGGEGLAILRDRERVVAAGGGNGGGRDDATRELREIKQLLADLLRDGVRKELHLHTNGEASAPGGLRALEAMA